MLYWTVVFMVIAIVAGIFGFGINAPDAAMIARPLFLGSVILFVASLLGSALNLRR
jgi:uncharacterized membrane protein YtjA (UPF0391 family)